MKTKKARRLHLQAVVIFRYHIWNQRRSQRRQSPCHEEADILEARDGTAAYYGKDNALDWEGVIVLHKDGEHEMRDVGRPALRHSWYLQPPEPVLTRIRILKAALCCLFTLWTPSHAGRAAQWSAWPPGELESGLW